MPESGGTLVDDFESGTHGNNLGAPWTVTAGGGTAKYDNGHPGYKADGSLSSMGAKLAAATGASTIIEEAASAGVDTLRFWVYHADTSHTRSFLDRAGTPALYWDWHTDGTIRIFLNASASAPYNASGYHTIAPNGSGGYSTGLVQYEVRLNYTTKTFTLASRPGPGHTWTYWKKSGASDNNIPFRAAGATSWGGCKFIAYDFGSTLYVDQVQYATGGITDVPPTAGDNWGWSDTAVGPPSIGSLGAGSVDYQGRVTFTFTEGSGAPTTLKVYRSADNSTFVEITSRCSLVDNGSTWTIIDKRPAYGSQAIDWGGTGYYKVRAYRDTVPASADTSVVTVTGIDVDANASEKAQWDALHALMSTQATREDDNHLGYPYSGHWLIAAANIAHKYADKRTQALADLNTWWTYVKGSQRTSAKLYKATSSAYGGLIYSEHCWRAVRDWIMCGYLIAEHDPTLASDLWACADETARATIDLLSTGTASAAGYGNSWPDPGSATAWAGSTARGAGDVRRPTTGNGRIYRVISAGGTTGSSEPTWPTTDRGTVVDGTVTWQDCTNDLPRFQTSHAYSLGEIVRPTTNNSRTYRVTTAGTSGGSEPTWPTTAQGTVTSGGVTFRETSVSNAVVYFGTYNGSSPYATLDFAPAIDNDFTLETAAALAALVGTPACTNFYTGGSYRTTALSLLADNVNHGLTMQVGCGATIKKPLYIEQYDSNYSVWSYEKLLTVVKFAGSLVPHAEAALTRFMDWLASDLSTEPRWSNGGDPDAYSDGKGRWECTFRADLYRARGLPQPSFRPDKLIYTSTMMTNTLYSENGQGTSGWAGYTETTQYIALPCLHYGVYAALPSLVTAGDTWGWTDAPVKTLPRAVDDGWGWSDSLAFSQTAGRTADDSWGWADSLAAEAGTPREPADTWSWTDDASFGITLAMPAADAWAWADAPSASVTSNAEQRTAGDTWSWTDALAHSVSLVPAGAFTMNMQLPPGTVVGAYLRHQWIGSEVPVRGAGSYPGPVVEEVEVTDSGTVTFDVPPGSYIAWAEDYPLRRRFFVVEAD